MDTLDGSYLKGSAARRQTRSAAMPPPAQPPAATAGRFPVNEQSLIQSSRVTSPNDPRNAGAFVSNVTMFSPNDSFNSSSTSHKLSSTHIVSTDRVPLLGSDESIMSYQKIRKVVTNSFSSVDAELRAKEDYLAHLKSIDVSKYTSPNE